MSTPDIVFTCFYFAVLFLYFFAETSGKLSFRAPVKIVLASMFLVYAFVHYSLSCPVNSIQMILMVALFLAWMGDVFLLVSFNRGGDFFLCGNVAFFAYYLSLTYANGKSVADFWWVFIVFAALFSVYLFLAFFKKKKILDFGKMKGPMLFYLSSIILHGSMGIGLIAMYSGTPISFMGIGSLLFMISDFLLVAKTFQFPKSKWVLRANSAFYFTGLYLIVYGFALMVGA